MGVPGGARPQPLRALGGLRKRLFLSQNMSLRSRRRFVLQQRSPGLSPSPAPAAPCGAGGFSWRTTGLLWARLWVERTFRVILGAELFSVVPAGVLVLVTWNNVPETQMALHPGPHTPPLGVLVLPASSSRPHSSLSRPHPALVFISSGPGRAQIRQALGTMAALGDGQEPPRVPSPVSLESLRTPGAHHHEARLSLRSHQHGTCLPPPRPRRPAGGTRGSPRGPGALAPSGLGRGAGCTG